MMNRHFISKKLWFIFVESQKFKNKDFDKNNHGNIFFKTVYQVLLRPDIFGGECSTYSNENYKRHKYYPDLLDKDIFIRGCSPYVTGQSKMINTSQIATNDLRAANILDRICNAFITSSFQNIKNFYAINLYDLAKVDHKKELTKDSLKRIYKTFYPTLKLNNKKIEFFIKNDSLGLSNIDKLNMYSYSLCRSHKVLLL